MDEPFSALDPLIRTRLQDELLELQARLKRTIVFVSHDLDEAFKLGQRIAIMEGGRIIQCGTPADIFTNPVNEYVADFVAHMNPLGVLTAADAMTAGAGGEGEAIPHTMTIKELIRLCAMRDGPIPVQREGKIIGSVDRQAVLTCLAR